MRKFTSVDEIRELFASKGSTILAIIVNHEELPFDRVINVKEQVKWTCANNDTHISVGLLGSIIRRPRDKYFCKSCSISTNKGGSYEIFVQSLETEGWKISSLESDYKNTKSMVSVICSNGHEIKTSQNKFSSGHRCKFCNRNASKKDIRVIHKEFEEKGFKLLSTSYENNQANLEYECKCGRIGNISYSNFTRNLGACIDCTKRTTYLEVEEVLRKNECKLIDVDGNKDTEFVLKLSKLNYICSCGTPATSLWKFFIKGSRCQSCNLKKAKETSMKNYGTDNPSKSEEIKKKIRDVNQKKYGMPYVMKDPKFVEQAKQTNLRNHGGIHNLNLPEIREKAETAFEEKHGASFGNVPAIREKMKETNLQKYGVEYPFQSKEIHDTVKRNNLEKYGNEVFIVSEAGKKLMIERYGVPYAAQSPEIYSKIKASSYSTKQHTLPSGDKVDIQGYEGFALDDLLESGIGEEDIKVAVSEIPSIRYLFEGKICMYHPDIYIKSLDLIIEIKSKWTYEKDYARNVAKFRATSKLHNCELWVYSSKGEKILERRFVDTELNFID